MSEEEGQFLNYPWQSFKERILVHHAIFFFQCSNGGHQNFSASLGEPSLGRDVETDSCQEIMTYTFKHSFNSFSMSMSNHGKH